MSFNPDAYLASKAPTFDPDSFIKKKVAELPVNDEMPAWLDGGDRTVVKNLSNNNDEAIKYLQGKYPDADIRHNGTDIILKKRGDSAYSRLDPSFSPISNPIGTIKDLWNDTKDVAMDVGQGVAEAGGAAVGALGGGLAGAVTGNPAGVALGLGAGGAAGAGAGSAAASALREKLAEQYGLRDFDGTAVAVDGAIGAVLPAALSGLGRSAKYAAKTAAPNLYAKATGLTTDALGRIAESTNVINPKTGKAFATKGDEFANMNEIGASKIFNNAKDSVDDFVSGKKKEFASKYSNIRNGSEEVDLSDVMDLLDQKIVEAEADAARTGFATARRKADEIIKMREEIFGAATKKQQGISDAMDLDSAISNDWIDWAEDVGQGVGNGRTVSDVQEGIAKDLRQKLRERINQSSYGSLQNTADEYSQFADQINFLRKKFKNRDKIQSTFKALNSGKDIALAGDYNQLDKELLKKLNAAKSDIDLFRYFQPTSDSLLSEQGLKNMAVGKAPIEKLLTALGTGAGYVSGGAVGGVVGAGAGRVAGKVIASPKSVRRIAKAGKAAGKRMDSLEKLLEENPALYYSILGGSASASE